MTIAIVDDDEFVREALVGLMQSHGLVGRAFESAESFLASNFRRDVGCLIADIHMPGMSGLELARIVASSEVPTPTILITARYDDGAQIRAPIAGLRRCLAKPFSDQDLLGCIRLALAQCHPPADDPETET
jgi:FixJ family two-component response regulator